MDTIRGLRRVLLGMVLGFLAAAVGVVLAARRTTSWTWAAVQAPTSDVPRLGSDTPSLRVEGRNDGRCVKTSEVDWKDGQGPLKRKFLRVLVYNDGSSAAEACTVMLRSVTEVTADGVVPSGYDDPGLLIWSGDRSPRHRSWDIPAGRVPGIADLFYTVHHPSGDQIVLKEEGYGSFLRYKKMYRFRLVVTAEGVEAVLKSIVVRFGNAWDDFEVVNE